MVDSGLGLSTRGQAFLGFTDGYLTCVYTVSQRPISNEFLSAKS